MSTITITGANGEPYEVEATDCGVPGLAITPTIDADGYVLTHVASGRLVGWWPTAAAPGELLPAAKRLAEVADWTTTDTAALASAAMRDTVLGCGGCVRLRHGSHHRWVVMDEGELTEMVLAGTDA